MMIHKLTRNINYTINFQKHRLSNIILGTRKNVKGF